MLASTMCCFLFSILIQLMSVRFVHSYDIMTKVRPTEYGPVRGIVSERVPGTKVEKYLGIPYASPPVGELRFEAPVPPKPWNKTLEVRDLPAACIQYDDMDYIQEHMPRFDRSSEDCLYLNVYVRQADRPAGRGHGGRKGANLLPVLLYIHGGSNRVGMGSMLEGDILAGQAEIIVVTFNYRLGIFGFLAAKDEGLKGTYGFLDQVEVFKWVRNNIRYFGGDPDSVTLHGHSAGAANVGFHVISPLSKGLFRRAIIHSGSPLAFWAMSDPMWPPGYNVDPTTMMKGIMKSDGPPDIPFKTFMKQQKVIDIRTIVGKGTPRDTITFPAVVDGEFLPDLPENLYRDGRMTGESFLITFARDEGFPIDKNYDLSWIDMREIRGMIKQYNSIYPNVCNLSEIILEEYRDYKSASPIFKLANQIDADLFFFAPIVKHAMLMSDRTDELYLLSFDHLSRLSSQHSWQGITHGVDLFYTFGIPLVGHERVNYTELDKLVSLDIMDVWSNFLRKGSLSFRGQPYVSYKRYRQVYNRLLSCGDEVMMDSMFYLRMKKVIFWNDILPRLVCSPKSESESALNLIKEEISGRKNDSNSGKPATMASYFFLIVLLSVFNGHFC